MRITELDSVDEVKDTDFIILDSPTAGTRRISVDNFKYAIRTVNRNPMGTSYTYQYSIGASTYAASTATGYSGNHLYNRYRNIIPNNTVFRGKNLGSSITTEQAKTIYTGQFDDLYLGDYWVSAQGIRWRIAHFDYDFGNASTAATVHYITVLPDQVYPYSGNWTWGVSLAANSTKVEAVCLTDFKTIVGSGVALKPRCYGLSASGSCVSNTQATLILPYVQTLGFADAFAHLPTTMEFSGQASSEYEWSSNQQSCNYINPLALMNVAPEFKYHALFQNDGEYRNVPLGDQLGTGTSWYITNASCIDMTSSSSGLSNVGLRPLGFIGGVS